MTAANIKNAALSRIGEPPVGASGTVYDLVELWYAHTIQELLRSHRWNFAISRTILIPTWVTPTSIADSGSDDLYRITKSSHGLSTGQRVTFEASTNYPGLGGTWRITVISSSVFDLDDSVFDGSGAVDADYTLAGVTDYAYSIAAPSGMLRALEDDRRESTTDTQWVLESGRILCNTDELVFQYVRDETSESVYGADPLFVSALILRLAIVLKVAIRGEGAEVSGLQREFEQVVAPLARRVDANEGQPHESMMPFQSQFVAARSRGV